MQSIQEILDIQEFHSKTHMQELQLVKHSAHEKSYNTFESTFSCCPKCKSRNSRDVQVGNTGKILTIYFSCDCHEYPKHKDDFSLPLFTCPYCHDAIQSEVMFLGKVKRVWKCCNCQNQRDGDERQREEQCALQRRMNKYRQYSLMDSYCASSTFENWIHQENKDLYNFAKTYCDNWNLPETSGKNNSFLLSGKAGCGKTYVSYAIANELEKKGVAVLATSINRILSLMRDSYNKYNNGRDINEVDFYSLMQDVDLLILDDLGTEQKTDWAYTKLYSVIDSRYRARKPVIITTNLGLEEVPNTFGFDGISGITMSELQHNLAIIDGKRNMFDHKHRIWSRLVEMCGNGANFHTLSGICWRTQRRNLTLIDSGTQVGVQS